jgi:hypothetical protein
VIGRTATTSYGGRIKNTEGKSQKHCPGLEKRLTEKTDVIVQAGAFGVVENVRENNIEYTGNKKDCENSSVFATSETH